MVSAVGLNVKRPLSQISCVCPPTVTFHIHVLLAWLLSWPAPWLLFRRMLCVFLRLICLLVLFRKSWCAACTIAVVNTQMALRNLVVPYIS